MHDCLSFYIWHVKVIIKIVYGALDVNQCLGAQSDQCILIEAPPPPYWLCGWSPPEQSSLNVGPYLLMNRLTDQKQIRLLIWKRIHSYSNYVIIKIVVEGDCTVWYIQAYSGICVSYIYDMYEGTNWNVVRKSWRKGLVKQNTHV